MVEPIRVTNIYINSLLTVAESSLLTLIFFIKAKIIREQLQKSAYCEIKAFDKEFVEELSAARFNQLICRNEVFFCRQYLKHMLLTFPAYH